jgi:cytoskeletal protein CcmA (bactofilin family)
MGKMLLIFILGMCSIFTLTHHTVIQSSGRQIDSTAAKYYRMQAQNIAESGIEYAYNKIQTDTNWSGISTLQMSNGTLSVSINKQPGFRIISSKGFYSFSKISRTVSARVQITSNNVPDEPETQTIYLNKAILTEADLNMSGNATVSSTGNFNADIHTNGDISLSNNGNAGKGFVKGYVTYAGDKVSGRMDKAQPVNTVGGLEKVRHTDRIDIPQLNMENLRKIADTVIFGGTKSGNITMGTKQNPLIVFVDGDLSLSGNVTGYGCFIVKGNLSISGNTSLTAADPKGNSFGLFVEGDVSIAGGGNSGRVDGLIYANGNVTMAGHFPVYGGIISRKAFSITGTADVYYKPTLKSITTVITNGNGGNGNSTFSVALLKGSYSY